MTGDGHDDYGLAVLDEATGGPASSVDAERVRAIVLAERAAKDLARWDAMAAAYLPTATVVVSWFQGNAADFVRDARARAERGGSASFHEIGPVSVVVRGDRALADATCAVHVRTSLSGVEVDVVSRGRLCWRVARAGQRWRIAAMDMIYFRDSLATVEPGVTIPSAASAEGLRRSYRNLARALAEAGHPCSPELPGIDRPDTVDALLAAQSAWLLDEATPPPPV